MGREEKRDSKLHHILHEFHEVAATLEDAQGRLDLLRRFADVVVVWPTEKERLRRRRAFNKRKGHDFSRLEPGEWRPCFVCWRPANHRHHIVTLSHGGDNRERNISYVCDGCHRDVHPWMDRKPRRAIAGTTAVPAIDALRTAKGGWTRDSLALLGVPWPPPKGWKKKLESVSKDMRPRLVKS